MPRLGPRLVVTGVGSGAGKTTVATGLMAALARRGLRVGGLFAGFLHQHLAATPERAASFVAAASTEGSG